MELIQTQWEYITFINIGLDIIDYITFINGIAFIPLLSWLYSVYIFLRQI